MKPRKLYFSIFTPILIIAIICGVIVYAKFQQIWTAPIGITLGLPTISQTENPQNLSNLNDDTSNTIQPTTLIAQQEKLPVLYISKDDSPDTNPSNTSNTQLENRPVSYTSGDNSQDRNQSNNSITDRTKTSSLKSSPASTSKIKTYCGGPEAMYILGIGADSGIDYLYGLADVIRIVRVDFVTPRVTVLSIPRDLWVEIPDLNTEYNITHGKINQAYLYGGPGMGYYDGPGGGPGLLARTLNHNLGIQIDYYGSVNMETFAKVVDALGGIDVVLPYTVDNREQGFGIYYAGKNHLNGEKALNLARIRSGYGDFLRQDHQTLVIYAILDKFKNPLILFKIPKLIDAFENSVLTDLSLKQISQLICLYPKLGKHNITFTQLPSEIMTADSIYSPQQKDITYIIVLDFDIAKEYIAKFKAGTWP